MNGKYRGCLKIDDLTYEKLRNSLATIASENALQEQTVNVVSACTLKPEESIGPPERRDFPLVKGREVMVEADFNGAKGQAFTDMPGDFHGTIGDVLALRLTTNFERAVFIATLNAVLCQLGSLDATIHCKDEEPEDCARCMIDCVKERYGHPKIAFVGLQPAMVDNLARKYDIRVTDMDPENQDLTKYGVPIEPEAHTEAVIQWGDVVFATGSTVVNDTYRSLIKDRPLVFYGVTVSGIAYLIDCPQYCHSGH